MICESVSWMGERGAEAGEKGIRGNLTNLLYYYCEMGSRDNALPHLTRTLHHVHLATPHPYPRY
jgi:hypothetical protein